MPLFTQGRQDIENAIKASEKSAHTFILNNENGNEEPYFYVVGCQGNASDAQKQVALLMEEIAKGTGRKPDFILFLGDNFYDSGIGYPGHVAFEIYNQIYGKIPCYAILGNHDLNFHKARRPFTESGPSLGMNQVYRTYYKNPIAAQTYQQEKINLSKLSTWNMPSRFYSLIKGSTQIICIDSNTYVKDYLEYQELKAKGISVDPNINQAYWLELEIAKAKKEGRKVILAAHHPIFTPGKRAYEADSTLYLGTDDFSKFTTRFPEIKNPDKQSYNLLFKTVLMKQKVEPDLFISAHDHANYYYNNNNKIDADYKIRELVAGGGGGSLQSQVYFDEQDSMGCYIKRFGFSAIECSKNDIQIDIHALANYQNEKNYHLHFDNHSCKPKRNFNAKIAKNEYVVIDEFSNIIKTAISQYFAFLNQSQKSSNGHFIGKNFSHGKTGIDRANSIHAYLSNYERDDFKTTVSTVYTMMTRSTKPSDNSLISFINQGIKLSKYCQLGITDLASLQSGIQEGNIFINGEQLGIKQIEDDFSLVGSPKTKIFDSINIRDSFSPKGSFSSNQDSFSPKESFSSKQDSLSPKASLFGSINIDESYVTATSIFSPKSSLIHDFEENMIPSSEEHEHQSSRSVQLK